MVNEELYPELLDYIFKYCGKFFWENEIMGHKHLHGLAKSNNGVNVMMYKFIMKDKNLSQEILDLVRDGYEPFKIKVATRIFNERRDQLELNLCPECNKIARTPWAKQCQFCFHDWH